MRNRSDNLFKLLIVIFLISVSIVFMNTKSFAEAPTNNVNLNTIKPEIPNWEGYSYDNSSKTGFIDLNWNPVEGATGYKIWFFNGKEYESLDVGNTTSYSTKGKKIWPTENEIANGKYTLHLNDNLGSELPQDPSTTYKIIGYYPDNTNYWIRLSAYNDYSESNLSNSIQPIIPLNKPNITFEKSYSNGDSTGYFDIEWDKVEGATGYKVWIFNGKEYESLDVGNSTTFSTKGKKLWPTEQEIQSGDYKLHLGDFAGSELPQDPSSTYKIIGYYPDITNYWVRVTAYNEYVESAFSNSIQPKIPIELVKPHITSSVGYINKDSETGYIDLEWEAVKGAKGYKVWIFNGKEYESIDVGDTLTWTTQDKYIWPTEEEISNGKYALHLNDNLGSELPVNPSSTYKIIGYYPNNTNFWIRITAYNDEVESPLSDSATPKLSNYNFTDIKPSLPSGQSYGLGDGTGYIDVNWEPIKGATGYKIWIFNGENYEGIDVGNTTSWSSLNQGIWPNPNEISQGRYNLHLDGNGTNLVSNPSELYQNVNSVYSTKDNYWIRVSGYNTDEETIWSDAFMPKITSLKKTTAPIGFFYRTSDSQLDSGYVDLEWEDVQGAKGYKVWVFNGKEYEAYDSLSFGFTTWTTKDKNIWPTQTEINDGRYALHHEYKGEGLPVDPSQLYKAAGGTYGTNQNFYFRISAYDENGETIYSDPFMIKAPKTINEVSYPTLYIPYEFTTYDKDIMGKEIGTYPAQEVKIIDTSVFDGWKKILIDNKAQWVFYIPTNQKSLFIPHSYVTYENQYFTSNSIKTYNSKSVNILSLGSSDNWYLILGDTGKEWVYYEEGLEKITIPYQFEVYDSPSFLSKLESVSYKPITLQPVAKSSDHWYQVPTSKGLKWVYYDEENTNKQLVIPVSFDTYNSPSFFLTKKLNTYNAQTVTLLGKYEENWFLIKTDTGSQWAYYQPENLNEKIYIPYDFTTYEDNSFYSEKVSTYSPQEVTVIGGNELLSKDWYLIKTNKGNKWVYYNPELEDVNISIESNIYLRPDFFSEIIGTSNIEVYNILAKSNNYWYQINSPNGVGWVYYNPALEDLTVDKVISTYSAPTYSNKIGTLNPQTVKPIGKFSDLWYLVPTDNGNQWINIADISTDGIPVETLQENNFWKDFSSNLNQGLAEMKQGLDKMNQGIVEMNQSLDEMNQGLEKMNQGLAEMNDGIAGMNQGLDKMNSSLAKTNQILSKVNLDIVTEMIEMKSDMLELRAKFEMSDLNLDINSKNTFISNLNRNINNIEINNIYSVDYNTANEEKFDQTFTIDKLHTWLDIGGFVPVIGTLADGTNSVIYLFQGDTENAIYSGLAIVPIVGNAATGVKYGVKGLDLAKGMPPIVQSRINISNDGWKHVVDRHFSNKNASQFTISQDELRSLLSSNNIVKSPVIRSMDSADGIRYVREITLDKPIGIDKFNNFQPTSTMTILTDKHGNLVTATPGVIK